MIFRDRDTIWETGPWYRYYVLGFLLRSLNISHEWFKNLRGYLASLANKLPKPCQVLIYLTFAAERNCQKFKRVHFKYQTSFHHLYSGLWPNFYSWVRQWKVCMSRLKARWRGLTSGGQTAQCPAATRFLPLTSWPVVASGGQLAAAGPRSHHLQPEHSFILPSMCQKLIIQCAEMHSQLHLHFQAFSLWFSLSWMAAQRFCWKRLPLNNILTENLIIPHLKELFM